MIYCWYILFKVGKNFNLKMSFFNGQVEDFETIV
jgi:hypothetical protein